MAGLLAALIDLRVVAGLFVCIRSSQPPVYLALLGVGTSNATLGSSLASFPCRPSPAPVLHTASDEKLEPGKAWERGYRPRFK